MAREQFRTVNFRPDSLTRIKQLAAVVAEYQAQGLRLTARQLYYQMVSRDIVPNTPAEYKKLTALLTDARYAGKIDWSAIEDRGREPSTPSEWDTPAELVESALRAYRLPRWKGQDTYVELWVEKQALAGVLAPIAREFHATLMVNKGYSSASAMKESADRLRERTFVRRRPGHSGRHPRDVRDRERRVRGPRVPDQELVDADARPVVLYLGDHDPSGEDMVRDIKTRLEEFGVLELSVEKVALTITQVKQYNPPPNPAKVSDPRAGDYIAKFGARSWEVDALPPNVLTKLIRAAFLNHVDIKQMDEVKKHEEADKELLRKAVVGIMKKRD